MVTFLFIFIINLLAIYLGIKSPQGFFKQSYSRHKLQGVCFGQMPYQQNDFLMLYILYEAEPFLGKAPLFVQRNST